MSPCAMKARMTAPTAAPMTKGLVMKRMGARVLSARKESPRVGAWVSVIRAVESAVSQVVGPEVEAKARALHGAGLFVLGDDTKFESDRVSHWRVAVVEAAEVGVGASQLALLREANGLKLTSCLGNGLAGSRVGCCLVLGRCLGFGVGVAGDHIDIDHGGLVVGGLGVVGLGVGCSHGIPCAGHKNKAPGEGAGEVISCSGLKRRWHRGGGHRRWLRVGGTRAMRDRARLRWGSWPVRCQLRAG